MIDESRSVKVKRGKSGLCFRRRAAYLSNASSVAQYILRSLQRLLSVLVKVNLRVINISPLVYPGVISHSSQYLERSNIPLAANCG